MFKELQIKVAQKIVTETDKKENNINKYEGQIELLCKIIFFVKIKRSFDKFVEINKSNLKAKF